MGAQAQEIVASGICGAEGDGSNLTWTLTDDRVFTISGSGRMEDYYSTEYRPWESFEDQINWVVVDDGVSSVGSNAFRYIDIKSVSLPASIATIGKYAFADTPLSSIILPESLDSIGSSAFGSCESLSSISIPNGVRYISEGAFWFCSSLHSVTLSDGLIGIDRNAFYRCESLYKINIPKTVKYIADDAFDSCESLPVVGNIRYADTYLLEAIDRTLTSYTIKEGTRFIGPGAFANCALLSSINIPTTVQQIGNRAFANCGLQSVEINSDIEMGYWVFEGCSAITSFSFLGSCTNVPEELCSGLRKLIKVELGDKVVVIDDGAFRGCTSLTNITLPKNLKEICYSAFRGCTSLTNMALPQGMEIIGDETFYGCSALTSITIPQSVSEIGDYAFQDCTSLPIVDNVRYADTYLIGAVDSLQSAYKIKEGTRWIGNEAFYCCTEMKEITIPETVETIGNEAFMGCASLDFISIPKSVGNIGRRAFGVANDYIYVPCRLKSVVSLNSTPAYYGDGRISEYSDAVFAQYTYFHAPLYVPEGSYWDYAYSPGWGEFIHIKEMAMDESALQSRQAYMIADARGCNYTVYDADKGKLVNVEYIHSLNEESEGSCWTVLKEGGKSYLYNIGAKKFASMDKDGKLALSDTPVNMDITATENGLNINGNACMFVLNKNIEIDATGIEDIIGNTDSAKKSEVYAIDGRRMDKAVRGINIVNGNKVLVK